MHIAAAVKKLSVAFPQMSADFFNLLAERIVKNRISARRLDYAVSRVLDTFTYKQLTIADIVNIDVRCRLLSYGEMCGECQKRGVSTSEYAPIFIDGADKPAWVLKVDKARYNLPDRL